MDASFILAVGAEFLPPGGGLGAVQRYSPDLTLCLQLQMDQSCSPAASTVYRYMQSSEINVRSVESFAW